MEAKFDTRHWPSFELSYMRDPLWGQQSFFKLEEVQQEVNAVITERDAALEEKNYANAERDSALLQMDIAYADKHTALVQRDNALAELAMIEEDQTNQANASELVQTVGFPLSHFRDRLNLHSGPTQINDVDMNHIQTQANQQVNKEETEIFREAKDSIASSPPKKRSKAVRKRQFQDQEAPSTVQKAKPQVDAKAMVLYEPQVVDISSIALPFCSCTGVNRHCYKWGKGGWQSSCCTNLLSEYPLPMRNTKRGSRVAGRKMTGGAFRKLLEKLAQGGIDITHPIDLKEHWAKHGTNKYITVR